MILELLLKRSMNYGVGLWLSVNLLEDPILESFHGSVSLGTMASCSCMDWAHGIYWRLTIKYIQISNRLAGV